MNLAIFTLVLDGGEFIKRHLPIFEQLCQSGSDTASAARTWQWVIVHGAANNGGSTKWCQPQTGRLSTDGTTEYLARIRNHPRVTVLERELWPSKDEMVNTALDAIDDVAVVVSTTEPDRQALGPSASTVLMQIDADEIWQPSQLEKIVSLFEVAPAGLPNPYYSSAMFACRYFVGPDLILQGNNCYGDYPHEWRRAWRFHPGQRFVSHEPPVLANDGLGHRFMTKGESLALGVGAFDHYAYATEAQAAFKEQFYGYRGAVRQWRALQSHDRFPVPLSKFFPWVSGDQPQVVRI